MKTIRNLLAICCMCIALVHCSNDDDNNGPCSAANWIGGYSGTCNDNDYSLLVSQGGSGSTLTLELIEPNGSTTSTGSFDGCNFSFMLGNLNIAATLDGDTILYEDDSLDCDITFTKN